MTDNVTRPLTPTEMATSLRADLKLQANYIKEVLMKNENHPSGADIGETKANIMLAYRHLEDCIMRLGKIIQAQAGGVSIYDK